MPTDERMVTVNGAACCLAVHGHAADPALLLVGAAMSLWPDELCARLVAGGRRVIRYDVRDTGRSRTSPPRRPGYSLADLVDDAVGVLDATGTGRAHVAGMSSGGWIAQLLALGHPDRVATLTLVASRPNTPGPVDTDLPEHDPALMDVIRHTPEPDWSDPDAVVEHLVVLAGTFAGSGTFDEAAARAQAEADVARTTDMRCATSNIAFADHGPRWRERLGEITARTLVLHGEDDPFFPIGNGEALAAEIPHARLVRLARVGHRLPAHALPTVAAELLAHTAGDTSTMTRCIALHYDGSVRREIAWTEEAEEHIFTRHGVTPREVEAVVHTRPRWVRPGREGTELIYGTSDDGRYLLVVLAPSLDGRSYVVTARDMTDDERRGFRRRAR